MSTWAHLARRFFGSLSRAEPSPADEAWVAGVLTPGEARLWRRMSAADRRHAVGVARDVTARLRREADGPGRHGSVGAAAGADVSSAGGAVGAAGGVVGPAGEPAGAGVEGQGGPVAPGAAAPTAGEDLRPVQAAALLHDVGKIEAGFGPLRRALVTVAAMAAGYERARLWQHRRGVVGRAGRYLCHDEIGANLLAEAGSDPLTVAWAREHHLPQRHWSVPAGVGQALKAADDD